MVSVLTECLHYYSPVSNISTSTINQLNETPTNISQDGISKTVIKISSE